jgi:hypothetical protein
LTALTDALAHPNIKRVFLAEITAGQHLTFWTLNSGSTWYAATAYEVVDVEENGASLTSRASIALVDANAGSWYFDAAAARVYVHCTASASPYGKTLQALVQFRFANHPKIFNDDYYEPRLLSVPNMSLRVERRFTGVGQVGGGTVTFENHDGWFDGFTDLQWDAGIAVIAFGVDRPGISEMAYGDYAIIGTWRANKWSKDDTRFSLTLVERKSLIQNEIPTAVYDSATYPNARDSDIGKSIPVAYGTIKDVEPACINLLTRRFKVAGHAITGFDAVRVKNTSSGAWEEKGFATTDLTLAEFTMGSGDWADGKEIAVDFRGKKTAGGIIMDNASDEPTSHVNTTSFTTAWNKLDAGAVFLSDDRATLGKLGVYIDEATQARKIIEAINLAVGGYLFSDSEGNFYYRVFDPAVGEGLTLLTEEEIFSFTENHDSDKIYSRITVHYNKRHTQDWSEVYVLDLAERQYLHNQPEPALLEQEAVLSNTGDAQRMGQRLGVYEGRPARVWKISAPARLLLTKLPGDFLHVTYARHDFDEIVEILELSHDLMNDKTTLTVADAHGHADRAGFWVDAAAVLPTRFSGLAGYGAGSLAWNDSWDDEIKAWARQNVGYWTDANGFASTTDPESFMTSTWT